MSTVAVLGAGSWGTTLAILLVQAGHEARIWGHIAADLDDLETHRENRKFLPGIELPREVKVRPELEAALDGADTILFVVPSQAMREVAERVKACGGTGVAVSASKGLELGSLERMSEVLFGVLGTEPVILTGPSHAEEVSRGIPTSVVAAARTVERANSVQVLCSTSRFRVYTNDDVLGCEIAASLKNVISIAAGVCDGIGFGDNTKGALLTRGLSEIARLGVAMGGKRETFFGLAGMGDLIATAMSRHSRNRRVGEQIGKGEPLERVLGSMTMVAEGVHTAKAARDLGRRHQVELPITEQVCEVLFEGKRPLDGMRALMTRDLRRESEV